MKPNKDMTFFIYGSIRKGMHNHRFVENQKSIGNAVVNGYTLYSLVSYPAIVKSGDEKDVVVGELYQFVDEHEMNQVHSMETCSGYELKQETAIVENGNKIPVVLYVFKHGEHLDENKIVKSGDWVTFFNENTIRNIGDDNEIQSKKDRTLR